MKTWSKVSLVAAGICLAIVGITQLILQAWLPFLTVLLVLALIGLVVPLFVEWRTILDFLSMRTTKHGLNMGTLILLGFTGVVAVNVLAVRFNKNFDLTKDRLNSLSDQSITQVKGLKSELKVLIFYPGKAAREGQNLEEDKAQLRNNLKMYEDVSSKIKVENVDSYVRLDLAKKYLASDKSAKMVPVVEYEGRQGRIEAPYGEEEITKAIMRVTRTERKKLYFLEGHGEKDLKGDDGEGLKSLDQALKDSQYDVMPLNLVQKPEIPKDANLIAIIGPKTALLDGEIELLKQYAARGGKLLIAADPGEPHQIGRLTEQFGVQFKNNYIVNEIGAMMNRPAMAVGITYSSTSEITKKFNMRNMSLFDFASEVKKSDASVSGLNYEELVKTAEGSFAVDDISSGKVKVDPSQRRVVTIGVSVSGKFKPAAASGETKPADGQADGKQKDEDFSAVIFGDSDFLSALFGQGVNRDLALNTFGYLLKDNDMISIRPKRPKGTTLQMTVTKQWGTIFGALGLPLLLLIGGGVAWFRRRGA